MGITTNLRKSPAKVTTRKVVASRRSLTGGNKPLLKDLTLPTQQCSNIKVTVRVRPQNEREVNSNQRSVIKVIGDRMLIFDPKAEEEGFFFHGAKVKARDLNKKENRNVDFNFDRVFGMESTNEEVFEGTTKEVVQAVMDGYNCSVFAYGATGAGKTHSMVGTTSNPGIIFLTVMELYARMEASKIETVFEVSVSYLEVYNETIRDLLANSEPLNIRDDGNNGFTIPGLSLHKPCGATDLLSMLEHGNKNRSQHPTDHNAESSRSHAVFQIWIKQRDIAAVTGQCRMAKMSLIDLAGSERGSSTNFKGERFREGTNINRSLLALGNCINALAEGRKHINYRDSKLTRLLKDSLGGNCKTVMIAAVSPSSLTYEDTYNTLRYADRAKKIKSVVKKNIRSVDFHISQYEQIITDLRSQVDHLKNKLQEAESKLQEAENIPPSSAPSTNHCIHLDSTFQTMKRQLDSLFHEKREAKRKLMQLATEENKLRWRDAWNQVNNQRSEAINFDVIEMERFATKTQRFANITRKKLAQLEVERAKQEERLAEYGYKIKELVNEWKQLGLEPVTEEGGENVKTQMELVVRMKQLEVQVQDLQDRQVHQQRLTESQAVEEKRSENLMSVLLKTLKQQHLQLKLHDKLSPLFEDNYKNLVSMVEARNVNWPDQHTESLEVSCPAPSICATLPKLFEMLPVLDQSVQLSPLAESQMLPNKQTLTTTTKVSNFSVLPCISTQEKPISSLKSASSSVQLCKGASATPPTPPVSTKVAISLDNYQNSPELKPKSLPVLQPTINTLDCTYVQEVARVEELSPHLDVTVVLEKVNPTPSTEPEMDIEIPLHEPEEKELETPKFATLNGTVCLDSPAKETDNGLDATYVTNAVYKDELVRERSSSHLVISKSLRRETFDAEPCLQVIHPTIVPLKDKENFAIPAAPKPLLLGKAGNNHTPSKLVAVVRRALTPKMKKTVSKSMTTLHDPAKPTYMNSTTASKLREANGQIITPTVAFGTTTGLAIKKIAPLANPVPASTTTSKVSGMRTMHKSTSVAHLKSNSHNI